MREKGGIDGTTTASPDFAMLKAALIAAQAATPTGKASANFQPTGSSREALHALFAGDAAQPTGGATLGHRFSSSGPEVDEP